MKGQFRHSGQSQHADEAPDPALASARPPYGLFAVFVALVVAIVVTAIAYYRNYERQFRLEVESELSAVAELKISELVHWRVERLDDGNTIYGNAAFSKLVEGHLRAPDDPELTASVATWMDKLRSPQDYRRLILLDGEGTLRMLSPTDEDVSSAHLVDVAVAAMETAEVRLVDFHRHSPQEPAMLTVIVPILASSSGGPSVGALAMEIDPGVYLYPMIQRWPSARETAETLLVRQEDDQVLFLNDLRFYENAALQLSIPLSDEDLPAAMVLKGVEGIVEGIDYRGVPVVAVVRRVPDSPWSLVAKIDAREIYAPLRRHLSLVLATVVLLLAVSASAVGLIWQQRDQTYYRSLYQTESRYGTMLNSIGDAVVATDAHGRVTLLNPVAEAMTGWDRESAERQPLDEVLTLLDEGDGTTLENPVTRILRGEDVAAGAGRAILATRDGREIPIAASGAPITDRDGAATGVVLVFRDQTQEREAQRRIREEMTRAQRYLEIAGVLIVALDPQGEITLINRRGCEILGCKESEVLGRNWFDEFLPPDEVSRLKVAFAGMMADDGPTSVNLVNRVLTRDGKQRLITWRNTVIRDRDGHATGVLSSGADITERRRAQEALERIEWMLDPDHGQDRSRSEVPGIPEHGDLVEPSPGGAILSAVGGEMLESIARDFLDLLDTSAAISESNGDYALNLLSSAWCRLLDTASRRFCDTDQSARSLQSGRRICRDECRRGAAFAAMESGDPVDIPCLGGMRLYTVPIRAGGLTVGAMSVGYGDPPRDPGVLQEIAETYDVDVDLVGAAAAAYESRPPFIIELAKRRIEAAAQLIGEIVRRKQATDALRASEEALSKGQKVAHLGSWRWHIPTNRLEWSDEMYRIFGLDKESFTGNLSEVISEAIHPDDRAAVEASNRSVIERQEPVPLEYRVQRPDGVVRTVWAEAGDLRLDEAGNPVELTGIVQDITERKEAEAELQALLELSGEQAQSITQIIETVPQGVLLLDDDGHIELANPVAASQLPLLADIDIYGLDTSPAAPSAENRPGRDRPRLTHLGDRPLAELLAAPPRGIWHEVRSAGRIYEVIARPIQRQREPERWVLVIQDVTEERLALGQLQQQERLAAIGQLAAGIAHDFNNIMGVIVLHAQMASRSPTVSGRDRERLDIINRQAHHAAQLIEQILDFSRRGPVERRPLDLLPLMKEQVRLLQRTLPETITVRFSHDPRCDSYVVDADPTRIQQVVMNLAFNARDAMPGGGTLQLSLRAVHFDTYAEVPVPQMTPGEWIALSASDTGLGIPPEALPHIFEPFYTTKERGQGSGLGLAQVHGIVAQHNGHVDVATRRGLGTTFTVYLPASDAASHGAGDGVDAPRPLGRGEAVLVVEDNRVLREALCETLKAAGYAVLEAGNGKEALELMHRDASAVNLVLSDVVMPEMGGLALARALKEEKWAGPVILMSGHPREHNMDELRSLGVYDWLPKPPNLEDLTGALEAALASSTRRP